MEIPSVDIFDEKYTMDKSFKSEVFCPKSQIGMLETYGKDFDKVREIYEQTPERVWTAIDGDDGGLYYVAGLSYVNRIYYLVTNETYSSFDEQYCVMEGDDE